MLPDVGALVPLGWNGRVEALAIDAGLDGARPGRVARIDRGLCTVLTTAGAERAGLAPALRGGDPLARPAVGDWVLVADIDDEPMVATVLPRHSAFVRGAPGETTATTSAQVVAANVDIVFVVQSLTNGPRLRRLERELVLAWESGATPVVVLSKADLVADPRAAVALVEPVALGVDVVVASSVTGAGIDELRLYASGHRTVALIGASGVGKSTIVNRLAGEDLQATADVREKDQRGRHTTVARELVVLPRGGVLVDTPGLRALGLWEAEEGLARAFADIEALAEACRFRDCRHEQEPDCAVLAAVERGELEAARLDSYRRLAGELDRQEALVDERARAERRRREKIFGRALRRMPKRH